MSAYELDDGLVREYLSTALQPNEPPAWARLAVVLKEQLPLPVPTKIGAVVRTQEHGTLTRTSAVRLADPVWIAPNGLAVHTEALGRITKVLSEGVDV